MSLSCRFNLSNHSQLAVFFPRFYFNASHVLQCTLHKNEARAVLETARASQQHPVFKEQGMSDQDSSVPVGFRVITNYPRYAINEFGEVLSICKKNRTATLAWSKARKKIPTRNRDGYYQVMLRNTEQIRNIFIHVLVLEVFVGPRPEGMQCRHIDGNPANNHVSNLAWGTGSENNSDQVRHGTRIQGETHPMSKLTADDVLEIRRRRANGEPLISLAREFHLTKTTVCEIAKRHTWKHI